MSTTAARRLSGLQKDVLSLYRTLLRSVNKKPDPQVRLHLREVVKQSFREEAQSVNRNDFRTIEHMLRHGHKQKKLLDMPGFTGATIVRKPKIDV